LATMKEPKLRAGDWSPQFSLKHMGKDLRLALESAGQQPLPQLRALVKLYETGLKRGWGDDDFTGLTRLL